MAPGAHTHDGFFFRFQFGASALLVTGCDPGFGIAQSIGIGGAFTPRLVFYGDISAAVDLYQRSKGTGIGGFAIVGLGAGLLRYFPDNVFIGGALGYGGPDIGSGGGGIRNAGGYLKLEAGREAWVSDNLALGYCVQLLAGLATHAEGAALSVLFSATYN